MATKKIGQVITRPGRLPSDPPIDIPIPEDLMTVPGIPLRQNEVDFYSREYPLESQNVDNSADRQWATSVLSPEDACALLTAALASGNYSAQWRSSDTMSALNHEYQIGVARETACRGAEKRAKKAATLEEEQDLTVLRTVAWSSGEDEALRRRAAALLLQRLAGEDRAEVLNALAAMAPPVGSDCMSRARAAMRVTASLRVMAPLTQAATYSPTECPNAATGCTPRRRQKAASAYSNAKSAGWA